MASFARMNDDKIQHRPTGLFWDDTPEEDHVPFREERLSQETEKHILEREQRTIQDYEQRKAWRSARLTTITNQWADNRRNGGAGGGRRGVSADTKFDFDRLFCCCMG